MADIVQYKLERMVDELEDLEQRGLFNRREIAEIVKQRRKYEYRLKRPCPLKQDFIAYIEYETQLDALRRLRKKSVARELKKQGNKNVKKSKSDLAGLIRIIDIYELALKRYKGDIDLWFRFLEFCRVRKNGRMKKVTSFLYFLFIFIVFLLLRKISMLQGNRTLNEGIANKKDVCR
jgi:U3 small nucleolar RNA-associated protein 6